MKLITKHNSADRIANALGVRSSAAQLISNHDHNQLSLLDAPRHPWWVATQSPSPLSLSLYGADLNRTNARLFISKCDTQHSQHKLVSSKLVVIGDERHG